MRLFNAALGRSSGVIKKTYHVLWLDPHTTVSCYQLTEPQESDIVYIELESTQESRVLELEAKVLQVFADMYIPMRRADGSLYDMYILGSNNTTGK
jgi:hypothetical protein